MKLISCIFLFLSIIINISFSKEVGSKKKNPFKAQKYNRILCNQKSIPLKIEQSLNAHLLTVLFTAEKKVEKFSLKNVRGIDGVTVSKFQELTNQKLESGETVQTSIELGDFSGLVYVVFDVSITLNGVITDHSIPVAVGVLSEKQKKERRKNIKEIKNTSQSKEGNSSMTIPSKKIHEMKLEE